MKIRTWLSIGFSSRAERKGEIDVPDDELEGLCDMKKDEVIMGYVQDWANNYIDMGYAEVEE